MAEIDPSHLETQHDENLSQGIKQPNEDALAHGDESEMLKAREVVPKSTTSEPDSVSHHQDQVLTRLFIVQWMIMTISTVIVSVVCFTFYIHYVQKELADNITKFRLEVNETEAKIEKMREDLEAMNIEALLARQDKQANLLVLLATVVIVLLFCVFWLYQRPNHKASPSVNEPIQKMRRKMECPPVQKSSVADVRNRWISDARYGEDLHDKACIIIFNAKLQGEITLLLKDLKMQDLNYVFCTVRKHEDITMLPRCEMFLMVCEFTERHVIIEQQGLGLGDLHRRTYDRTMEINGNLIILYIHDPGSRNLRDKHYNEKIHCVKSQQELSGLRDTGSFFSCYNKLTDFQINKLREKFNEFL